MAQLLSGTWLLDTNILVAFMDKSSAHHDAARGILVASTQGQFRAAIAYQNILELTAVLIHGYKSTCVKVAADVQKLLASNVFALLYPSEVTIGTYLKLLASHSQVHTTDLFLASTMITNGVTSIITSDADFEKIPGITVYNPFRL